jgi:1,4-alpha-glucan branching enzyme
MKKWLFSSAFLLLCLASFATSVTFSVNVSDVGGGTNGVFVAGSFQGWNATATPMTDQGNGVYSVTLDIVPGGYLYKFINGTTWETGNAACGASDGLGGFNRSVIIADAALVLPTVCFNGCTNCLPSLGDAAITFAVDMRNETVSANGVHIAGNFQNWNPATTAMTDSNGDGVYTYTAMIPAPYQLQYKFINGNTWLNAEAVPALCGEGNDLNRTFTVSGPDVLLDTVCFSSCEACPVFVEPIFVSVVFNVDMQNETVSADGVYLAGNFQGWNPSATEMTDVDGDGVYSYVATIAENDTVDYKFINGIDWLLAETVPASCGVGNDLNRRFVASNADAILDTVCFSSCSACVPVVVGPTNTITISVNMSALVVAPAGMHIAGNFQGWNPASTAMTDMGNGIWSYTFNADEWANLSFKFINGNTWAGAENVPSGCGLPDGAGGYNRILQTGTNDFELGPICFGTCDNCPLAALVPVTFAVNMNNETVSPNGVHIAGTFQGWNPSSTEMTDTDGDGIYTYATEIMSGSNLSFKFINGNTWNNDEQVPAECGSDDGTGNINRSYTLSNLDFNFGPVCFSGCVDCEPIVQPTTVEVTFEVNMANQTVSANGVHVAGNFQGYDPAGTEMTDADGDGIYSANATVNAGSDVVFVFINGNDWPQQEAVPSSCGVSNGFGGFNRSFVADADTTFGPICFGECADCQEVVVPGTVQVTLQVNMQNEVVSANGIHVAGNFQGWSPTSSEMTDTDGDGIYEITVEVDSASTMLFKFINGNDWPQQESVPAACGQGDGFGGFNRIFEVDNVNATYGPVCFSSCNNCSSQNPVLIRLQVDMQNEVVSPSGVFVAGTFNNWSPTETPLTLLGGVYQTLISVNAGETISYKFLNGSDWTGAESVPLECGLDDGAGNINRSYSSSDQSQQVLPVVCFSSCSACLDNGLVNITFTVDLGGVTPSPNGVHIAGTFNSFSPSATQMTLVSGSTYTATVAIAQNTVVDYKYLNGNAWGTDETVPFECGFEDATGNLNRRVNAVNEDFSIPTMCFGECAACSVSNVAESAQISAVIYPNPANEFIFIETNAGSINDILIFSSTGQIVQRIQTKGMQRVQIDISTLGSGVYSAVSGQGEYLGAFTVVQ